jgi:hypothetical protein
MLFLLGCGPLAVAGEIEDLRARIAELEKSVSAARASMASRPAAGAPKPHDPAPDAGGTPAPSTPTVSTAAARDAGSRARPGSGDAAETQILRDLFRERAGPAFAREVGHLLGRGEPAYATLYDFVSELDQNSREAILLSYNYRFSFSLSQTIALHEDEVAKFAHYFLAATENAQRSTLRRTLFDFLPVLLRYRRGRYPDLERDMEEQILARLTEGKGDLQMYYRAMESLGYKPPLEVFDPLLDRASSHAETLPVALHLEARNDPTAVRILSRCISRNAPENEWKAAIMLGALSRMSIPHAENAILSFLQAPNESLRAAAMRAYFAAPRDGRALPILEQFLNSEIALERKSGVVAYLKRQNPGILESLREDASRLRSEEVRRLLEE